MLRRKTLKTLSRLFTQGLSALPSKPPRRQRPAAAAQPTRTPRGNSLQAAAGRWLLGVAVTPTGRRRYRLFMPAGRPRGQRIPLLVMLHGCDQNATGFATSTRMHRLAARAGFAVLFPEQDRLANPHGCWNWHETRSQRAFSEAALILQSVDQACTLYGCDRARVAIAGLSAGAGMAALVATRYPHRFQAVAMHSGVPPGTADSTMSALSAMAGRCETAALGVSAEDMLGQWPALLVIQGGQDRVVAPRNGEAAVQAWAQAAQASPAAVREVRRGKRHPMLVTDYRTPRGLVATLVQIPALGHAWSGGAAAQPYGDPAGPDASRLIWAFAQRQFAR
jgi:poly(hydroxyalkanoate) depolymerase family esterase